MHIGNIKMGKQKKNLPPKRLRGSLTLLKNDSHHKGATDVYNPEPNYFEESILNKNVRIFFQPIVDMEGRNIHAFEALSRGPKNTPLSEKSPFAVIDVKNHSKLDRICLENIINSIGRINQSETFYFINCLLTNIDFLRSLPVPDEIKSRIVVEFDLNNTFFDLSQFLKNIERLQKDGFNIALDDIGETNIDFNLVKLINPKFVKIDISIIRGIATDEKKQIRAKHIINLAHELGAAVIAEGVEVREDLEVITNMGVRYIQGFLFSKAVELIPQKTDEIAKIVKRAI